MPESPIETQTPTPTRTETEAEAETAIASHAQSSPRRLGLGFGCRLTINSGHPFIYGRGNSNKHLCLLRLRALVQPGLGL